MPDIEAGHVLRGRVEGIYDHAKGIRDGTHVPIISLKTIGWIADMARRRRPDGTLESFEESPLWPVYRHFHPVRMKWIELQSQGKLTPELADDLQAEMWEAALSLLGESRSHRETRALRMYERGRLRRDDPAAAGMSSFIIQKHNEFDRERRERGVVEPPPTETATDDP
jgi:hypothetical protein